MRKFYFLLVCQFFFGCEERSIPPRQQEVNPQKIVSRLRKTVGHELQGKYGLVPVGTGGQMHDQVEKLMLIFNYPLPLSEEEGRELVINAVDYFLNAINQNEQLRPFLANDPFTHENVEITIFLQDNRGTSVQPDKFIIVEAKEGYVCIIGKDPQSQEYINVLKEPFEEAKLKISKFVQR